MLALTDFADRPNESLFYASLAARPRVNDMAPAFAGGPVQLVPAREDLFLDGDDASHAFEVLDGIVCAYRISSDGERQIISFYYPGDILGYCCDEIHSYSAQALTTVRVRRIPRLALERTIQQTPEMARRFLRLAGLELTATRDHLVCLGAKSAAAKVASFLLALSRRNRAVGHDPAQIRLPMTRTDIGDYLGLTIETVSRTLSRMKRKGLIDIPKAAHLVIRDPAGLNALTNV